MRGQRQDDRGERRRRRAAGARRDENRGGRADHGRDFQRPGNPGSIYYYQFDTDTSGKFASLSLAARLPADFPGSGLFGDNVMRRVTFDVENVGGTNNLVMNQSPLLEVLNDENTPYPITLARDVSIFMLEFWSEQDGDWATSLDVTNAFPPMIRVTLGVGHPEGRSDVPYDLIVRTIAMPCKAH